MVDVTKLLTVREAARRLDLTEERVRELIGLKQIRATKIKRWRITPGDLAGCGKTPQPGSGFEVQGSRERLFSTEMRSSFLEPSTMNLEQEEFFRSLLRACPNTASPVPRWRSGYEMPRRSSRLSHLVTLPLRHRTRILGRTLNQAKILRNKMALSCSKFNGLRR